MRPANCWSMLMEACKPCCWSVGLFACTDSCSHRTRVADLSNTCNSFQCSERKLLYLRPMSEACVSGCHTSTQLKVLVTGASGKTGALVVQQLLKLPGSFEVCVVVRSDKAHKLMLDMGVTSGNIFHIDLSGSPDSTAALKQVLQHCQALVICTSAVPEVKVLQTVVGGVGFMVKNKLSQLFKRKPQQQQPIGDGLEADSKLAADPPFVPIATWKAGQTPEKVDYLGQVAQIDAAKAAGTVQHIVLISSAGGCDPNHFLNHIGSGDILNWKRLAEQHLINSGITYTILHPNHLVDPPAGTHQVVLGVDDELQQPHWRERLKMPRSDLAALAVQALLLKGEGSANRAIDCAAKKVSGPGEQATTTTEQFKQLLQQMPHNCNYSINDRTQADAVWACRKPAVASGSTGDSVAAEPS